MDAVDAVGAVGAVGAEAADVGEVGDEVQRDREDDGGVLLGGDRAQSLFLGKGEREREGEEYCCIPDGTFKLANVTNSREEKKLRHLCSTWHIPLRV